VHEGGARGHCPSRGVRLLVRRYARDDAAPAEADDVGQFVAARCSGTVGSRNPPTQAVVDRTLLGREFGRRRLDSSGDEGGVFDIQRGSMDVEMAVRTGSGGQDVTRTRLTADDKGYLTMLSWSGRWANCWLPLNSTALQSQLAGEERLPVPVAVLLHVEVADPDQAGAEIRGQLDAFSALRLQGYSAVTLRDLKSRLLRTRVPITVSVDDDPVVVTARLEGADIEKALRRAGTQLSGGTDIRRVHTEVEITQVGEPVDIKPPDPDALLPNGATKSDRCAASGR
jgi:hypothetical protein